MYWTLLVIYIALMYWGTVFSREVTFMAGYKLELFWTYRAIVDEGKNNLIGEILANFLMFIPIGILVGLGLQKRGWLIPLLTGVILSLGIEFLQLYLKVGLCETDDIIHNTIGCLLGFAMVKCIKNKLIERDDTSVS